MKTAISVPGQVFERASRCAEDLGMSRSEFFARAAQRYLDDLDANSITDQIDAALDLLGTTDESATVAVTAGRAVLDSTGGDW